MKKLALSFSVSLIGENDQEEVTVVFSLMENNQIRKKKNHLVVVNLCVRFQPWLNVGGANKSDYVHMRSATATLNTVSKNLSIRFNKNNHNDNNNNGYGK